MRFSIIILVQVSGWKLLVMENWESIETGFALPKMFIWYLHKVADDYHAQVVRLFFC